MVSKVSFQSQKKFFTIVFNHETPVTGYILPDKLRRQKDITEKHYTLRWFLNRMNDGPAKETSGIMIFHDNGSVHKTEVVKQFL